jgi:tetratricopeptide (TPR) repeat protein
LNNQTLLGVLASDSNLHLNHLPITPYQGANLGREELMILSRFRSQLLSYYSVYTLPRRKIMNQTYRMLAIVGFTTVLAGLVSPVHAQLLDGRTAPRSSWLVTAQAENNQARAVELYNQGVDKLDSGDYRGAIASFDQAIQLDANDADTYYNRGYAYHSLGNYDKAISDYSAAIRIKADFDQAYSNRGYAQYVLKNYREAIADCTKAIELNPKNDTAYVSRGNAHDELGEHQKAIADYEQALKINPDNAMAYYNRGLTRNRLKEHQAAIADYTESIRIQPTFAEAFYNRGLSHFNLEQTEPAIKDLQQAAELFQEQGRTTNYQSVLNAIRTIQQ